MFGRIARRVGAASLIALAAPVMAQVEPPPLDAYGELPTLEDIAISPGGRMVMLTTSGGKRVLVEIDPSMKPVSAMEVGDIKIRGLAWMGDEAIMVERSDTQELGDRFMADSAEFFNAMIVPAQGGGDVRMVFADNRDIVKSVYGWYGFRKVDGAWRGYFGGLPMAMGQGGRYYYAGGGPALYAVDMQTNKARRIASAPLEDEYLDWLIDAQGEIVATLSFRDETGAWRIENAGGTEIAAGTAPEGAAGLVSLGQDGEKVIYAVTDEHGDGQYFEVPLSGGAQPKALFEVADVDTIFRDVNSGKMIGYLPEGDKEAGEPVFFDPSAQKTIGNVITQFRHVGGELRGWTSDFGRILLSTAGNNDSGTWYLVDTKAGQASVIGRSRPSISPYQVGPISTIFYEAQDGLEIEAVLTLPPGREAKGLPLVMLPHGGPRAHDEATFDWWAQAFASRGYAVLQPNFRGSTEHGDEFMHAGDGEWGKKMQTDLSDGIAYLAEQGIVDPERACIVGASYGGYAALAGVTLQQGQYRCAVAVAGVSDLEMFLSREYHESGDSKDLRDEWLEMMGPRDELEDVSPRTFAARADAPILLIHGRDDTVVPYEQSTAMADSLKDAGRPYELVELEGEDHWLSRSETRKQMLEEAVAFVQQHNPPD